MRILAIADRAPLQPISQLIREWSPEVIVTLGDLEMSDIRSLENVKHIPKLGVYGNHCSGMYMPELGIVNMHMATIEIQGVRFGGFEGCVRYKQSTAKMYTQEEASEMFSYFPYVDILLTHCPPYGVNDDTTDIAHTGFIGSRDYIEREHPKLVMHGHTYPTANELVKRVGSTRIEYVFGSALVEV